MSSRERSGESVERSPELRRARVRLGEVSDLLRDMLASVLRPEAYEVIEVEDGVRLLEQIELFAAREQATDLIVSDGRMPGRSGARSPRISPSGRLGKALRALFPEKRRPTSQGSRPSMRTS